MSGMAVHLCLLIKHPQVTLGSSGSFNQEGFLSQLLHSNQDVECRMSSDGEVRYANMHQAEF